MAKTIWIGRKAAAEREAVDARGRRRHGHAAEERQREREEAERSLARAVRQKQAEPSEAHEADGPRSFPFSAEIDLTELDTRYRPGLSWSGRAVEVGPSHVVFRSRRMCYEERRILIAVHLIDAMPVALYGEVVACEYDGEGMYRTELALLHVPELDVVSDWIVSRSARGAM